MRTLRLLLIAAVAALCVVPGAASASTITASGAPPNQQLLYNGLANEPNDLTLGGSETTFTFVDAGATISSAPPSCSAITGGYSCPRADTSSIQLNLADGNDAAHVTVPNRADRFIGLTIYAGSGNDTLDLTGSGADATYVAAEDGNDTVLGGYGPGGYLQVGDGPGADTVRGGPAGGQTFMDAGSVKDEGDTYQGGAGDDIVEYESRTAGVTVTAGDGQANDGEPGEGDNVDGAIESIQGTDFPDTLVAGDQVNTSLSGYDGNDVLRGGAGDDTLFGGKGDDQSSGGAGDDTFPSSDRALQMVGGGSSDPGADSFSGGPGTDTLDYSDRAGPSRVSLDGQADDGAPGEGDNVSADIEVVQGGTGDDTLIGTAGAQRLFGNAGNDTIDGGPGGGDFLRGGSGADSVLARNGAADDVDCGLDADTASVDFVDVVNGCETLDRAASIPPVPVVAPDKTAPVVTLKGIPGKLTFARLIKGLTLTLGANEPSAFDAEILGTARKASLAKVYNLSLVRRTLPLKAGSRKLKLKPSRRLMGKTRKLTLRLRVIATDAAGNRRTVTKTLKVRRR